MKRIISKVIVVILVLTSILVSRPAYAFEPVTTVGGVILMGKVIGWAATGISAAKTAAEIAYQNYVSGGSISLYKSRLNDIDGSLDDVNSKITSETDPDKLKKLSIKRLFILQEKTGLGTVLSAIGKNRDVVVKKKVGGEIKSLLTGYVGGELVPLVVSKVVGGITVYVLTSQGEELVGALHTLQGTVLNIPPDMVDALINADISDADKQFYLTLAAEQALTKTNVAMLEAEFDKYINEVARPMFNDYLAGESDDYLKLPLAIRKIITGEYEAEQAEWAKGQEELLAKYKEMYEEYMKNKEKMAQARLEVLQEAPEVIEGVKQIVGQEPKGDDEKLAQLIASLALAITGEIATGEAEIPEEGEAEVPEEEEVAGVIHLVGTISVNSQPYRYDGGLTTMATGSGTIELFLEDGGVTGETTGWVRTYIRCDEERASTDGEGNKYCPGPSDDKRYNVGEWMPMPSWDINLNAELDGWYDEPSEHLWPHAGIVARPGGEEWEQTYEKYGCWNIYEIGGNLISDTEAEGFINNSHWYWEADETIDEYGITWHARVQ